MRNWINILEEFNIKNKAGKPEIGSEQWRKECLEFARDPEQWGGFELYKPEQTGLDRCIYLSITRTYPAIIVNNNVNNDELPTIKHLCI